MNKNNYIETEYNKPFIRQRADPYVYRHSDGSYYFTASVPEYDRIVLRRSNTLNGLRESDEVTIWKKHDKGIMSVHIWAPEIHYLDNKWFIYYAGGDIDDRAALFADGLLTEHLLCRCLRQKQVALCVCTDHAVEALLRHLQQISAHLRRDARVIDKHIDTAKLSDRFFDQLQSAVMVCDIAADIAPFDTVRSQPCQRLFVFFLRPGRRNNDAEPISAQPPRNGIADAAAGAGDDRNFLHDVVLQRQSGEKRPLPFPSACHCLLFRSC